MNSSENSDNGAAKPENEAKRLQALYEYDVLDSVEEEGFDALTKLAARICNTPVSLINLIDEYRQWTKSSFGSDIKEIPRSEGICQYTILNDEPLEIKDLAGDPRFRDMTYVKEDPGFRYYAGVPLKTPDGHNIGAICVIDTEHRELENWQLESLEILAGEAVAWLNSKLRQKKLLKANDQKDEVLRIVSHDIRNQLTGILGVADLIRNDGYDDDEELEYFMDIIEQSAHNLLGNMNDLIDIAQIESGGLKLDPEQANLKRVVDNIIRMQKPGARIKKINLEVAVETEKEEVSLDPNRFGQILSNLVMNAIKFTPSEGTVSVSVTYPVVRNETDHIMIKVSDTGIGIPEEFIPVLFTRYGEHRREGTAGEKSTGMGLPLLKSLVDAHQGTIDVHSEVQKGSEFTVLLPELET